MEHFELLEQAFGDKYKVVSTHENETKQLYHAFDLCADDKSFLFFLEKNEKNSCFFDSLNIINEKYIIINGNRHCAMNKINTHTLPKISLFLDELATCSVCKKLFSTMEINENEFISCHACSLCYSEIIKKASEIFDKIDKMEEIDETI